MNAHLDDLVLLKRIPLPVVAVALGLAEEGTSGGRYRTYRGRVGRIVANIEKGLWNANGGGSGSVIDLVMVERQISFTAARQWLRALVAADGSFPTASPCFSAPKPATELITTLPAGRVARQYLAGRGLDAVVIDAAISAGVVTEIIRHGRRAVAFPHLLDTLVVGCEVRNPNYKGFAGHKTGLWQYGQAQGIDIDLIVVVESAVDGLAYAQLQGHGGMLIVSTGGNPARVQMDALRQLLDKHPSADLVGGHDADSAGDTQAMAIQAVAADAGRMYKRHRPSGKDWAEQLNGGGV